MKQADKDFVIEDTKIVEIGSYESLLSRKGRFWKMGKEFFG
jgi:ABC-type multidrug transport system fused ATPase/permease subunit